MNPIVEERIKNMAKHIRKEIDNSRLFGEYMSKGNEDCMLVASYYLGKHEQREIMSFIDDLVES